SRPARSPPAGQAILEAQQSFRAGGWPWHGHSEGEDQRQTKTSRGGGEAHCLQRSRTTATLRPDRDSYLSLLRCGPPPTCAEWEEPLQRPPAQINPPSPTPTHSLPPLPLSFPRPPRPDRRVLRPALRGVARRRRLPGIGHRVV